jgi:putative transposase
MPGARFGGQALGRTHADFAKHFNIVGRSCGHVWQARFFSCPLDGPHTWQAMAYIERNPVRAGLVTDAADYHWSSAAEHTRPSPARPAADSRARPVLDLRAWESQYDARRWAEVLRTSIGEEALAERIRQATLRGRPLGSKSFVHALEQSSGRRLQPRPPGRPRKEHSLAAASGQEQMSLERGS